MQNTYESASLLSTLEAQGFNLSVEQGRLKIAPASKLTPELREALQTNRDDVIACLTVPRLPWQLERLVNAAASDSLKGVTLPGIHDEVRYTLAWTTSYLVGDRDEALRRLWQVYRAWQPSEVN